MVLYLKDDQVSSQSLLIYCDWLPCVDVMFLHSLTAWNSFRFDYAWSEQYGFVLRVYIPVFDYGREFWWSLHPRMYTSQIMCLA
jgi:hypothetical protein